jgi:hypothetical protein
MNMEWNVKVTFRRGMGRREDNGGGELIWGIIHLYMEML